MTRPAADVSVIIPCYNGEKFITETVQSVLDQTVAVREVIVIDDGSKDRSAAIVRSMKDQRASGEAPAMTLMQQANAGESKARNVGIAAARGAYIALLDADDLWLPEKIARQMALLVALPTAAAVHTRVFNFERTLDDRGRAETERSKDDPTVADLIEYHYVSPSSVLIRREAVDKGKLRFDETTRHSEDMLFMADLRLVGPLRMVDEPLVAKRVHGGQQTRNPWHPILSIESRLRWCRSRREQLGPEHAAAMEAALSSKLIEFLERRYWARQFEDFAKMRDKVAQLCPDAYRKSAIAGRRLYPAWMYRLRDLLSKRP